jgi:hypothetical protein
MLVSPMIEPRDVNEGRGWLISFDDGVAHHVQIGHNSIATGIPRSFQADGETHELGLRSPQTVSFAIGGRPATLTRSWVREPVRRFLRRYFTSLKALMPGVQQRHATLFYELIVDGAPSGTWIADMPDNVLREWRYEPPAPI